MKFSKAKIDSLIAAQGHVEFTYLHREPGKDLVERTVQITAVRRISQGVYEAEIGQNAKIILRSPSFTHRYLYRMDPHTEPLMEQVEAQLAAIKPAETGAFEIVKHGKAIVVTGDTYNVRKQLKAAGGKWLRAKQGWMYPATKRDEIEALIATF